MLEQKKLPILEALAAFGIGGIFTAACMAGLAYLMANQSLAQSTAWPMVSAIVCAGSFAAAGSWRFSITAEALSAVLYRADCLFCFCWGSAFRRALNQRKCSWPALHWCLSLAVWAGCSVSCVQNGTGIENLQQKNRRTGKYVGLSGNTGNRSGKGTARSDHVDSTGRAVKTEEPWSSS